MIRGTAAGRDSFVAVGKKEERVNVCCSASAAKKKKKRPAYSTTVQFGDFLAKMVAHDEVGIRDFVLLDEINLERVVENLRVR